MFNSDRRRTGTGDSGYAEDVASGEIQGYLDASQYADAMIQKSYIYKDYIPQILHVIDNFLLSKRLSSVGITCIAKNSIVADVDYSNHLAYKKVTNIIDAYRLIITDLKARIILLRQPSFNDNAEFIRKFNRVGTDIQEFFTLATTIQRRHHLIPPADFEKFNIINSLNNSVTNVALLHTLMIDRYRQKFFEIQQKKYHAIVADIQQQYNPQINRHHQECLQHSQNYNVGIDTLTMLQNSDVQVTEVLRRQQQAVITRQTGADGLLPLLEEINILQIRIKNYYDHHYDEGQQIEKIDAKIEQLQTHNAELQRSIDDEPGIVEQNVAILNAFMQHEYNEAANAHDKFQSATMMLAALKAKGKRRLFNRSEYQRAERLKQESQKQYQQQRQEYVQHEQAVENLRQQSSNTIHELMTTIQRNAAIIKRLKEEYSILNMNSEYTLIPTLEMQLRHMEQNYQEQKQLVEQQRSMFSDAELTHKITNIRQQCHITYQEMIASKAALALHAKKESMLEHKKKTALNAVSVASVAVSDAKVKHFLTKKLKTTTTGINRYLLSNYTYMQEHYWQYEEDSSELAVHAQIKSKVSQLR